MNAIEILKDARATLATGAWIKGTFLACTTDGDLCYCAHGAIYSRLTNYPVDYANSKMHIRSMIDGCFTPAEQTEVEKAHVTLAKVGLTAYFNDDPDTTLEMVLAKYDEAIAALS